MNLEDPSESLGLLFFFRCEDFLILNSKQLVIGPKALDNAKIMNQKQLQILLHQQIPLSQYMKVQVVSADPQQIELHCELEPNHNHLGTAFGGSLSCLMILASYCQIFQLIDNNGNGPGHVLLKSSATNFLIPVQEKLKAVCKCPSKDEIEQFLKIYNRRGKARLTVHSQILLQDGRVACSFQGEFVGTWQNSSQN